MSFDLYFKDLKVLGNNYSVELKYKVNHLARFKQLKFKKL